MKKTKPEKRMEAKNTVPILEKALDVLEYIGASRGAVSLPELQRNLGIAQASCYRIATTLLRRGWLEKCSGNLYNIAPGVNSVAEKVRFHLERYRHLQPFMNRIANRIGFSVKFSVRDGDEFVNVSTAQCRSEQLRFSEPGFRSQLGEIATVSTIFLAESAEKELNRILHPLDRDAFSENRAFYLRNGFSFIRGQTEKDAAHPFDTLSFPVRKNGALAGTVSFLSRPGILEEECGRIAAIIPPYLAGLADAL